VRTEFQERTGNPDGFPQVPKLMWLTPEQVASDALDAARKGRADCVPGRGYRLASVLMGSPRDPCFAASRARPPSTTDRTPSR